MLGGVARGVESEAWMAGKIGEFGDKTESPRDRMASRTRFAAG